MTGTVQLKQELEKAAIETLETMCFACVLGPSDQRVDPEAICSVVSYHGDAEGAAALALRGESARELAAAFLGCEQSVLSPEQVESVVAELSNMVCGAMLSRCNPSGRFRLDAPFRGSPELFAAPAEGIAQTGIECDCGPVWISVCPSSRDADAV